MSYRHVKFLQHRKEAIETLEEELKFRRKPTEIEIAKKMGLTLDKYLKKLQKFPINAGVVPLSHFENDEELTEEEIANRLQLTSARINRIKKEVIDRLRNLFKKEGYTINNYKNKLRYNKSQKKKD